METVHKAILRSAADLAVLESESIDLVVTSPPYPMIEMWDRVLGQQDERIDRSIQDGDGSRAFELMHQLLDAVWRECYRVLKPGAFACINIGDATRKIADGFRLYTNHSRVTSFCESLGFQSLPAILWRKQTNAPNKFMGSGMLPSGAYVTLEHEYILILRKGGKRRFTNPEADRRKRSAFFWEERNVWFSDLWDFKGIGQELGDSATRKRSAAFPFELAFRLINMYSMKEDTVLDPFLGTGTTMLAAMASARNSIGVEIDGVLATVIEHKVQEFSQLVNQRQLQRLNDHACFVREYRQRRERDPGYLNVPHGFPVVTRQEIHLSIPMVVKILKAGPTEFSVHHQQMDSHAVSSVKTQGFALEPGRQVQLGLGLMD